jgi:hypothetical protein
MRRVAYMMIVAGTLLFGMGLVAAYQETVPREGPLIPQGEPDDDGP